ncbi:hypothetical protein ABI59_03130 [Acidobacteria bacterium Mor1]|nr:hypothetical protein ABI59_03130 [Acidobacteria bacterium Mor1]
MFQLDTATLLLRQAADQVVPLVAKAAAQVVEKKIWVLFGHARCDDYTRECLGRSGRWLRDMARLGRGLERFPRLGQALDGSDGERPLGWVAATLVLDVASEGTLDTWLARARSMTVRELRGAIGAAKQQAPASGDSEGARAETSDTDRRLVRIGLPSSIRDAFDACLKLFRAVSGSDLPVSEFLEAMLAEAHAGPHPPDVVAEPLRRSPSRAEIEALLERSSGRWSLLTPPSDDASVLGLMFQDAALRDFMRLRAAGSPTDPAGLHDRLRRLLALVGELERRLGRVLAEMSRRGAWRQLGFSCAGHYAEERLGMSRTSLETRARIARRATRVPTLEEAYESGQLGTEAALLALRAIGRSERMPGGHGAPAAKDPGIRDAWVRRAREVTVKRLRDEVAALGLGPRPSDAASAAPPTDESWHRALELRVGDTNAAVERCSRAGTSSDVFLRFRLESGLADELLGAIESARRLIGRAAEELPWDTEPSPGEHAVAVHMAWQFTSRCRRVPAWVGLLAMLEDFSATWDRRQGAKPRAEAIYVRDGWRCAAPGCTSRRNLEDHHVQYRSRGGDPSDPANRICLCRFHHQRGEHGGLARCRGRAPLGLLWRLGRKDLASWYRNERRLA